MKTEEKKIDTSLKERQEARDRETVHLTDLGNTQRFVKTFRSKIRWCEIWKRWLIFNGGSWEIDDSRNIFELAKTIVRQIYREASDEKVSKERREKLASHALKCESEFRLSAMINLAKSEPGIPISPDDLDKDSWLLNVGNGTLNLKTGNLKPYDKLDYITKYIPTQYNPEAKCPAWLNHLNLIFNGDWEMIAYFQRCLGYSLTGNTNERAFFIEHGEGFNGKTVTNETIARLLNSSSGSQGYSMKARSETFLFKHNDGVPNDIAALKGSRFVYCSETAQGKRLDENLVKELTGGDTITARFLYSESFQFIPKFKLWIFTNNKPDIREMANAIWDRVHLIPFEVRIPEDKRIPRDKLDDLFLEEFDGILTWLINGCGDWQAMGGLWPPKKIVDATREYRDEMDVLKDFIEECCIVEKGKEISRGNLFGKYREWCQKNKEHELSQRLFIKSLKSKGLRESKIGRKQDRKWFDIGLI